MKRFFLLSLLFLSSVHTSLAQGPPPPMANPSSESSKNDDDLVDFPEVDAQFKGKATAIAEFISKNVRYPEAAINMNISGKVYISFVVEKDGSISNVTVERGVHPLLDAEAMRVIRIMPKWKPAKDGGKKVRSRCRVPIVFTLE